MRLIMNLNSYINAKKTGMFRNKRVDIRHATWRTAQAVQVLRANFPKSLSWCFPSVLDCQTKLYTYSAIFSFSSPLGVLEHSSFGIYCFKADDFLSVHCVPCVLCPRLRVLRVNSILTWLTWKHFRPKDLLERRNKKRQQVAAQHQERLASDKRHVAA